MSPKARQALAMYPPSSAVPFSFVRCDSSPDCTATVHMPLLIQSHCPISDGRFDSKSGFNASVLGNIANIFRYYEGRFFYDDPFMTGTFPRYYKVYPLQLNATLTYAVKSKSNEDSLVKRRECTFRVGSGSVQNKPSLSRQATISNFAPFEFDNITLLETQSSVYAWKHPSIIVLASLWAHVIEHFNGSAVSEAFKHAPRGVGESGGDLGNLTNDDIENYLHQLAVGYSFGIARLNNETMICGGEQCGYGSGRIYTVRWLVRFSPLCILCGVIILAALGAIISEC